VTPIRFFNRRTGSLETERVYGDFWLRLLYGPLPARPVLHAVAKRAFFSRWYGRRMKQPASRRRIAPFIAKFGLDCGEFADPPPSFATFNDFFIRRLKPEARPVDPRPHVAVFPCDGRHLGFPEAARVDAAFVKGQHFDLEALLGSPELARRHARGPLVLSRLSPADCHRFHFPADGVPSDPVFLNGFLFSVSPYALRRNLAYLWQNKRFLTKLRTERFGTVLMVEIGATNVGSVRQTHQPGQPARKGSEKGYFEFGGSALITLFEPGAVSLAADLLEHSANQTELYAPSGTPMAE